MGYVKKNAIAGHSIASWEAFEAHLADRERELGREAILAGYTRKFTTATTLVAGLAKATASGAWTRNCSRWGSQSC
ncbi:hypothetical protein GA0061098_104911 [Bradyrhizobium shewense]|uniref:Uncharacterized protein n=1 Tax=Bradyrhizobium shewense TaxID=1761772 RepID=A0A1C3XTW7_9BRAD|nr:hypothetical protein GA0061098_104911 [Bradyrhizobium shewense]